MADAILALVDGCAHDRMLLLLALCYAGRQHRYFLSGSRTNTRAVRTMFFYFFPLQLYVNCRLCYISIIFMIVPFLFFDFVTDYPHLSQEVLATLGSLFKTSHLLYANFSI